MKYISIFFILFCLSITLNAQSNYKRGFIITNEKDTIMGLVDFRTDRTNSKICKFKKSEKAEEQVFYPKEIFGYMFIDETKYYISQTINIKDKNYDVFLEYLVKGIKDLYFYSDETDNLDYYFLKDEDGKMISFTKEPDKIIDNTLKKDDKYKRALNYAFRDCEAIANNVDKVDFGRRSMIKLTEKYHKQMCSPGLECIVFENNYKKKFTKINLSLYSGTLFTDYSFGMEKLVQYKSVQCLSPVIGGQFNISSPRLMKSLSIQADISLSSLRFENDHIWDSSTFGSTTYEKFKFKALITTGELGFKYTHPNGKFSPTIEVGISYSILSDASNSLYSESIKNGPRTIDNYVSPPMHYWGGYGGIGLNYQVNKKHVVFCRIIYNRMSYLSTKINGVGLKIGYML